MEETKRRPGRPATGVRYRERLMVYTDAAGKARVRALGEKLGVSDAEVIRRAVEELAKREGVG
jgi:hypothetical protein